MQRDLPRPPLNPTQRKNPPDSDLAAGLTKQLTKEYRMSESPFFLMARAVTEPSASIEDVLLATEAARQESNARRAAMLAHPSQRARLTATVLDTSAEDANHAKIVALRERSNVIDLDSKRGERA